MTDGQVIRQRERTKERREEPIAVENAFSHHRPVSLYGSLRFRLLWENRHIHTNDTTANSL